MNLCVLLGRPVMLRAVGTFWSWWALHQCTTPRCILLWKMGRLPWDFRICPGSCCPGMLHKLWLKQLMHPLGNCTFGNLTCSIPYLGKMERERERVHSLQNSGENRFELNWTYAITYVLWSSLIQKLVFLQMFVHWAGNSCEPPVVGRMPKASKSQGSPW